MVRSELLYRNFQINSCFFGGEEKHLICGETSVVFVLLYKLDLLIKWLFCSFKFNDILTPTYDTTDPALSLGERRLCKLK